MLLDAATRRFSLILLLVLAALLALVKPNPNGDVVEYSLTTIAMASHGTPDIRLDDIARGRVLLPQLAEPYGMLEKGMRANDKILYAAFTRGRDGDVYAIHFFGYSALAALPYKLFELAGADPMKGFQVVNLAAIFLLGLCFLRLFKSEARAFMALALFMLCGGILYWSWTSPECLGAAALLAGLVLFCSGAPLRGALLAGLAAQQNPTILAFFGFAPLLHVCLHYDAAISPAANVMRFLNRRHAAALLAGIALFAVPPLFNLWQFGVPNIIARLFSDPTFIGGTRLASFFFDLNQGMLIAIPGVLLALAIWGWTSVRRDAVVLALCAAFTLALALPALAVLNWNSGAAGVMRYAFWAGMPLVFALVWRLQAAPRWPLALLVALGLVQAACMVSARSYSYVEFSPAARLMMRVAPQLYHPEPEIFVERLGHHDNYYSPSEVYVRSVGGVPVTTLYNTQHPGIAEKVCGKGGAIAADNDHSDSYRGWRYVHGPVRCTGGSAALTTYGLEQFKAGNPVQLESGWSAPEAGGGNWDGAWSQGKRSRIVIALAGGARPASLTLLGQYFKGNTRTRVSVNGVDMGWHKLDVPAAIALALPAPAPAVLQVELEHEAPQAPGGADTRELAFFLRQVTLQ